MGGQCRFVSRGGLVGGVGLPGFSQGVRLQQADFRGPRLIRKLLQQLGQIIGRFGPLRLLQCRRAPQQALLEGNLGQIPLPGKSGCYRQSVLGEIPAFSLPRRTSCQHRLGQWDSQPPFLGDRLGHHVQAFEPDPFQLIPNTVDLGRDVLEWVRSEWRLGLPRKGVQGQDPLERDFPTQFEWSGLGTGFQSRPRFGRLARRAEFRHGTSQFQFESGQLHVVGGPRLKDRQPASQGGKIGLQAGAGQADPSGSPDRFECVVTFGNRLSPFERLAGGGRPAGIGGGPQIGEQRQPLGQATAKFGRQCPALCQPK